MRSNHIQVRNYQPTRREYTDMHARQAWLKAMWLKPEDVSSVVKYRDRPKSPLNPFRAGYSLKAEQEMQRVLDEIVKVHVPSQSIIYIPESVNLRQYDSAGSSAQPVMQSEVTVPRLFIYQKARSLGDSRPMVLLASDRLAGQVRYYLQPSEAKIHAATNSPRIKLSYGNGQHLEFELPNGMYMLYGRELTKNTAARVE